MSRYLVLGANGLIGRSISTRLEGKSEWFGTYFKREESGLIKLDITSASTLRDIFNEVNPHFVINCTNLAGGVDFCESHPDLAEKFILEANVSIGELCKQYEARMVLISTDYVFNGETPPYKEDDEPDPLNLYGALKLKAEQWLANHLDRYTIARTTNVFGWDPLTITPNYMMSLYRAIKSNTKFKAPLFLWGNPTYVVDLTAAIIELCSSEMNGIFHVVGSSFVNRYDWAITACRMAGWNESSVTAANDIPDNMVPRPLNSNLSTEKFRSFCKTELRDLNRGLKAFLRDMKDESKCDYSDL